jgi:hypothetical protein
MSNLVSCCGGDEVCRDRLQQGTVIIAIDTECDNEDEYHKGRAPYSRMVAQVSSSELGSRAMGEVIEWSLQHINGV